LVFIAVICDLGTHYSSSDVLIDFQLFQVLFMSMQDVVEMELRALGSLGELRKLASRIELMGSWVLQGAHAWGYKVVGRLDIADIQWLLKR
jgi:hypothetical protein